MSEGKRIWSKDSAEIIADGGWYAFVDCGLNEAYVGKEMFGDFFDRYEKLNKLHDVVRLIVLNKGHRAFSPYMAIEKLEKTLGDME